MKKVEDSFQLKLTNTLTDKKESFIPLEENRVTMYVCGITPYDFAHLGHGRCYVTFDVLYRLLTFLGYDVTYCRNFTDIDDKLINRAEKELGDPNEYTKIAQKFIKTFHQDVQRLNCLPPNYEPKVTEHIPQIISFIQGLIDKGKAYISSSDVYFSIDSFADYGKLSKRDLEDLKIGARVEVNEKKKNPLDFVLWKHAESRPGWSSPWGYGRPGWHIECSALAKEYLGQTIDIHAGGLDLIFPHHENEIAQSEGLHGKEFARYWIHNAFVLIDKEKMSKSLGNFVTLHQILEQYDPMIIRYYILIHHYRNPLDFTKEDIEGSSKSYKKLVEFQEDCLENLPLVYNLIQVLCDDLNIAKFFGIIFENIKKLSNDPIQAAIIKSIIQQTLGLTLEPIQEVKIQITPEIQNLIDERERARKEKDWAKSDEIRDKLLSLGIEVHDKIKK
jgi:cysteinyl-tRNA synthetase